MYDLQSIDPVILDGTGRTLFLRDTATSGDSILDIDAQVASGDCLSTIATSLDDATDLLSSNPEAARPQIEKSIRTLLYLQHRYSLVRKNRGHRQ